jgi:response regulator RpfG family c-di-GMP phosphodiesterase
MIVAPNVGSQRRPLAFVLDDEPAVATMICKQLTMIGMEAWQFSVPSKFLTSLRVSRPKLVVLDLALGQSDAVEVIQELDALKFTGRVLLISGRDERTFERNREDWSLTWIAHAAVAKETLSRCRFEEQVAPATGACRA